ncbi:MAG: TetR/AcrR family transcriptional regulator [Comamonadaceae bacterium]|nr:TetR/AcrR family transcriptional regulator [Comamonadaceae bacterium]
MPEADSIPPARPPAHRRASGPDRGGGHHLAGRHSPAAITTGDIAREVGVTQGALFKHFPSREAIWLAVMEWVTQHLLARLENAAKTPIGQATANPALDALAGVFAAHIEFVRECPGVPRLIFHDLQQPADSPLKRQLGLLLQRYRQLLTQLLQDAVKHGEVPANLDVAASPRCSSASSRAWPCNPS